MTTLAAAQRRTVPGPRGLPILGHVTPFLRDKLGFLEDCVARYGTTVRLRIGEPTLLVADPEDIRHVLITSSGNYDKSRRMTSARGRRVSGSGVLTASGKEHTRLRKLLAPLFRREVSEEHSNGVAENARGVVSGWGDGDEIELGEVCARLTQRNIQGIVFGRDFEDPEFEAAIRARREYFEYHFRALFPFPELVPCAIVRRHRRALRVIDRVIADRLEGGATHGPCLLEKLTVLRDDEGRRLGFTAMRDEVRTLCVTGYETLGEALTWALYLLAEHPDAAARLHEECDRVLGAGSGPATPETLPYTYAVLQEAMRLYPPTWLYVRMARKADVLPSGAAVAAGSKIYLSQWVVHRHPGYFDDPLRFDPDRFGGGADPPSKFTYFPFGVGPRVCLGKTLGELEGVICLALLSRRHHMELIPGQNIVPEPGITLRPRHGVRVRLRRRES